MARIARLQEVSMEGYNLEESMNQFIGRVFIPQHLLASAFHHLSNIHLMVWLGVRFCLHERYVSEESAHPSIADEKKSSLGAYSWLLFSQNLLFLLFG